MGPGTDSRKRSGARRKLALKSSMIRRRFHGWFSEFLEKVHPMKLFLLSFLVSALLTVTAAYAQETEPSTANEPLTSGSPSDSKLTPGWARFEPSPAQPFLVARAREDMAYRLAIARSYQAIGFDLSRPQLNATPFMIAAPPLRVRYYMGGPGYFVNLNGSGY